MLLYNRSQMLNISSASGDLGGKQYCPVLENMRQDSHSSKDTNLVVVCFHGLISCLGILENALILWVLGFRLRRRTVPSVWVLNLAMSDFLATLTLPLFTIYLNSHNSWELGSLLCKVEASIFFLNMFVSAFLLAAISVDRCILVAKPAWSQNHRSVSGAWKVCGLGWLWAAVNTIPYLAFRSVTERVDGKKLCYHDFALYPTLRNCNVLQAATAVSKLLLAFLLPLVVIAGSYIRMVLSLRNRRRRRRNQSITERNDRITAPHNTKNIFPKPQTSDLSRSQNPFLPAANVIPNQTNPSELSQSFTKMVTVVTAVFMLCWAPYHIFCMIEVAAQYWDTNYKLVKVGLPLATTTAFLNSVLNPILYAFSCPHFCVRIQESLGAVFDGLVEDGGGTSVGQGRSRRAHFRRKDSIAAPGSSASARSIP